MLQLRTVNKELQAMHPQLKLEKGEGYFYFIFDDGGANYETESVYVNSLNQFHLGQWKEAAAGFLAKHVFKPVRSTRQAAMTDYQIGYCEIDLALRGVQD